jgi:hypothetical protein
VSADCEATETHKSSVSTQGEHIEQNNHKINCKMNDRNLTMPFIILSFKAVSKARRKMKVIKHKLLLGSKNYIRH